MKRAPKIYIKKNLQEVQRTLRADSYIRADGGSFQRHRHSARQERARCKKPTDLGLNTSPAALRF